ncbi:hypothetical protein KKF84_19350 [Myxococcota bacterium]|nr:hypothetical protein [Myxococcota bacterium]MBU1537480.1 hypothetical protein [Myxococcota bacterium]
MKIHTFVKSLMLFALVCGLTVGCGKKDKKEGKGGKSAKSSKKWDKKDFKRLAKIDIPGFKRLPGGMETGMNGQAYFEGTKNAKGFIPNVWAIFNPCIMCQSKKMGDMAAWKKMLPNLNMMLSKAILEDPKLVNKLEEMDFDGTKVMTVYTKSFLKKDKSTTSAHGLDVYYNNGTNELILKVYGRSRPHKSIENLKDLEESFTKKEMIDAAKAAFKHLKKEL